MKTAMRVLPLVLLLGCEAGNTQPSRSGSSGVAAPQQGVRFDVAPPAVGQQRVHEKRAKTTLNLTVQGLPTQMKNSRLSRTHEALLGVEGDITTKMKVTVSEVSEEETVNGLKRDKPQPPTRGKTYVLHKTASGTEVLNESGASVPLLEKDAILEQFKTYGQKNPVSEALGSRAFAPGDRFEELETQLSDLEGFSVEKVEAKFRGKDALVITFDVSMTLGLSSPYAMTIALEGQMLHRASDGWPLSMKLDGDIQGASGGQPGIEVTGGHMSLEETVSYEG